MKNIFENSIMQTLLSIIILLASFVISSLQGFFGFWIPFLVLILFILIIILIYYVISIPLLNCLCKKNNNNNSISLDDLKKYEATGDFKEIWIVTFDLEMAVDVNHFAKIIKNNVQRNIQYKFFVINSTIAKERAKNILLSQKENMRKQIKFYTFDDKNNAVFLDKKIDYDLFFAKNSLYNEGYIGITICDQRNYVLMPSEMFLNLKYVLEAKKELKIL